MGAGDRLETGRIAGERQRRQEFDRQRRARPLERLSQVVDTEPAAPLGERDVRRRPDRPPIVAAPAGGGRTLAIADAFDNLQQLRQRRDAAGLHEGQPDRVRIVRQSLVGGLGERVERIALGQALCGRCGGRAANGLAGIGGQRFQKRRDRRGLEIPQRPQRRQTDRLGPAAVQGDSREPVDRRRCPRAPDEQPHDSDRGDRDALIRSREGNLRTRMRSARAQSETKRRPMYLRPAIVSPCGTTLLAISPIVHSRDSARSRPGTPQLVRSSMRPPDTGTS